eukprot:TRINITY_DN1853_c0_g1_i1.p1 TRINITY_DN1853_c0_g1~~TRINITY_DN1853_c0_g1_i1.p1  ORF type:complete len:562 (+),score=209.29 TRINITY_DN1853_c0_g1_i1:288-1973(+)
MFRRETGASDDAKIEDLSDTILYKIDVPANRYDLLSLEGLSRALRVFRKTEPLQIVKYTSPEPVLTMTVKPDTAKIRPHVVCAVLRDVTLTEAAYNSFLDIQDKLHHTICRRRTLVAIGTHDLDTIEGPFSYEALAPKDIKFKPLFKEQEYTAEELMEVYKTDNKLKAYIPIIRDSPVYPVIYDNQRRVLSMPPIINGEHSKMSVNTKNILIECTATDITKAHVVLNTLVSLFSTYCKEKFTVERVKVVQADGTSIITPDLSSRDVTVDVDYINRGIGINIEADQMAELLDRMQLPTKVEQGRDKITLTVPPVRSDILHPCDVVEDVAIAYGYNNIKKTVPKAVTVGKQLPVNQFSDLIRNEVARAGYTEVLSLALCSRSDLYEKMNRVDDGTQAITISNPATYEFQTCRTSLLPGLLKTVAANKAMSLPLRLFEVSDVVFKTDKTDVGARNERHLSVVIANTVSSFESIHGLMDRVMKVMGVNIAQDMGAKSDFVIGNVNNKTYTIKEAQDPSFFPGQCASVVYDDKEVGLFGVIHPAVLKNFDITTPVVALELIIEEFV